MSLLYHPILYVIQVKMLIKESRICKIQVCAGNQKLRDKVSAKSIVRCIFAVIREKFVLSENLLQK